MSSSYKKIGLLSQFKVLLVPSNCCQSEDEKVKMFSSLFNDLGPLFSRNLEELVALIASKNK